MTAILGWIFFPPCQAHKEPRQQPQSLSPSGDGETTSYRQYSPFGYSYRASTCCPPPHASLFPVSKRLSVGFRVNVPPR